jgi:hypothetical protein
MAYRKFTRQRGSIVSVNQFWAGDDHLLLVSSSFGVENYRRFYYHDIEAFIIRPTSARRNWTIANVIGLAIFGGLTLYFFRRIPGETGFVFFYGFFALMFLIGLIWQLVMGPTCRTFLQMRTGLERIAMANRIRSSLKLRDRLAALIGAAAEARAVSPAIP